MSTITVDIHNPQINWQDVLTEMRSGSEVLLLDRGTPVARLEPFDSITEQERTPGLFPNSVHMRDDFDEPLPAEFWLGEDADPEV